MEAKKKTHWAPQEELDFLSLQEPRVISRTFKIHTDEERKLLIKQSLEEALEKNKILANKNLTSMDLIKEEKVRNEYFSKKNLFCSIISSFSIKKQIRDKYPGMTTLELAKLQAIEKTGR